MRGFSLRICISSILFVAVYSEKQPKGDIVNMSECYYYTHTLSLYYRHVVLVLLAIQSGVHLLLMKLQVYLYIQTISIVYYLYITQYGSTVYIGIAMVYPH